MYIKKPILIAISSCKNKNYEFIGIGREYAHRGYTFINYSFSPYIIVTIYLHLNYSKRTRVKLIVVITQNQNIYIRKRSAPTSHTNSFGKNPLQYLFCFWFFTVSKCKRVHGCIFARRKIGGRVVKIVRDFKESNRILSGRSIIHKQCSRFTKI